MDDGSNILSVLNLLFAFSEGLPCRVEAFEEQFENQVDERPESEAEDRHDGKLLERRLDCNVWHSIDCVVDKVVYV